MSPDPVKCPDCGSTQIGGGRTGSRVSGAMLMEDSPLVPVLHSGGQFLNTCMACGYEWSPAAVIAARGGQGGAGLAPVLEMIEACRDKLNEYETWQEKTNRDLVSKEQRLVTLATQFIKKGEG